jgi:hypothetical protein
VLANLETATIFAQTAPRARVDAAVAKITGARELAQSLDVHFLIRGTLTPAGSGYTLSLVTIDGATEQPLATERLPIPRDALKPVIEDDIDTAVFHLLMAGMHAEVQHVEDRPAESLDVRDLSFRARTTGGTTGVSRQGTAMSRRPTFCAVRLRLHRTILSQPTRPPRSRPRP